jgi:4-hydroxy-tetrahydrodipicolinate synthase
MSVSNKFIGTGVAIITPFKNDLSIDFPAIERHVEYLISNGVNYLVILGTTGEAVTQSEYEKNELVKFIIEKVDNRVPLVLGVGGNSTNSVIDKIQKTDFKNIDAILSVSPFYNKPTQEGIFQHFKAIAEASPVPIILYNVPSRTGSNMTAETTLKLAHEFENIVAIKEASGNISQAMYIIKDKPKDFLVISGEDALTLPLISAGVSGVISVVANALPKEFSTMVNFALENKMDKAQEMHYKVLEFIDTLFIESNPAGVKAALKMLNLIENNLRLPLTPVSENTYQKLENLLSKIKK